MKRLPCFILVTPRNGEVPGIKFLDAIYHCESCDWCETARETLQTRYEPSEPISFQCVISHDEYGVNDDDLLSEGNCPIGYDLFQKNQIQNEQDAIHSLMYSNSNLIDTITDADSWVIECITHAFDQRIKEIYETLFGISS